MAAILRVKRKKEDEPLDALLISCKRSKLELEDAAAIAEPLTAIVKFAGTVDKQEDCVVQRLKKTLRQDVLKANFKQRVIDVNVKAQEKKQESKENRYKIINNIRSLDTSGIEELDGDIINIIDIVDTKDSSDNKDNTDYVYDLYYSQAKEPIRLEDLVSVAPVEEDLVFEDYYKDNPDECRGESEDSNSESNWRNDYPDENSDESEIDEDIRHAMKNMNVDDELSSDSDFVYGLDEDDVERYGYKYAKYKSRIKNEEQESSAGADSESSENSEIEDFDE